MSLNFPTSKSQVFAACLVAAAFAVSCGSGVESDGPTSQSPVVLNEPPKRNAIGNYNGVQWAAGSDSGKALFAWSVEPTDSMPLADMFKRAEVVYPGQVGVLFARWWKVGTDYFFVAATVDASDKYSFYASEDVDGDGVPNDAPPLLLVQSAGPGYPTDVTAPVGGVSYVLDARCLDIRRWEDQNADGLPDTISSTVFAMSQNHAHLLDYHYIDVVEETPTVVVRAVATRSHMLGERFLEYHGGGGIDFTDTDANGVADSIVTHSSQIRSPAVSGELYDGQDSVIVWGPPSTTIEIYDVVASGGLGSMIGSGTTPAGTTATSVVVSLSTTLDEGDVVAFVFAGVADSRGDRAVGPFEPGAYRVDPRDLDAAVGGVVTIHGNCFSSDNDLWLVSANGTVHALASTFVNEHEITTTIPALPTDEQGRGRI